MRPNRHVACGIGCASVLETDRYLYYDDDPVIRTCTRSVQARDLALVLWDRADGAHWRWSGSIVVRR